jgi:hypothetical protein
LGLAIVNDILFAARHSPWLGPPARFESWSDLSGVSHRRAGFFSRKEPCARRPWSRGLACFIYMVTLALQRA